MIQRKGEKVVSAIRENRLYPVLVYHKVDVRKEFGASAIHPDKFRKQVKFLRDLGYQSVNMTDMLSQSEIPDKQVCFVFDDAYDNVFHYGFPVLKENGFTATIGIITDYIGRMNDWDVQIGSKYQHLDTEQIKQLKSNGWELASHTCSHKNLLFCDRAAIQHELTVSKNALESMFHCQVSHLIYPYGRFNSQISYIAKQAGYSGASAFFGKKGIDPDFGIQRKAVYSFDTTGSIVNKIRHSKFENLKQRIVNFCSYGSMLISVYKMKQSDEEPYQQTKVVCKEASM